MKKALAMALGAVLVAGSAAPASAASQIDFSGLYRVEYIMNGNLGYTGDDNVNDSYFTHRFQGDVTFQATDEVSVVWRFRGPAGKRWGGDDYNRVGQGLNTRFVYGQVVQDWGTIRIGRLPGGAGDEFGLSTLGWAPALDNVLTYIAPFEGSTEYDGIQYSNSWDNGFSVKAAYAKAADGYFPGAGVVTRPTDDHDADRYQIEGAYMWDGGGASLNVMYLRDATANPDVDARTAAVYDRDGDVATPSGALGSGLLVDPTIKGVGANSGLWQLDKSTAWFLNPAIMHSWGAFSVHAEAKFGFGEDQYIGRDINNNNRLVTRNADSDGAGFYIDFDYNYGPGRVNLAGWWVSGTDIGDTERGDLVDIQDGNFYPLVAAYGPFGNSYTSQSVYDGRRDDSNGNSNRGAIAIANAGETFASFNQATVLNNTATYTTARGITVANLVAGTGSGAGALGADANSWNPILRTRTAINNADGANHWALMLSGQHAFTDEITFNYALAYLALVNPNFRAVNSWTYDPSRGANNVYSAKYVTQDKDLGWEIDLGVNVQLLDNLAFTSTVGYLFTGDAYKQLRGYRLTDGADAGDFTAKAVWDDSDDVYSWVNSLVFTF